MSAEYAGHGPGELVWRPGAASRSPLYLLLCLATPGGDVFVDCPAGYGPGCRTPGRSRMVAVRGKPVDARRRPG